jgi:hypothetical protein
VPTASLSPRRKRLTTSWSLVSIEDILSFVALGSALLR